MLVRGWFHVITFLQIARLDFVYFLLVAAGTAWALPSTAAAYTSEEEQKRHQEYTYKSRVPKCHMFTEEGLLERWVRLSNSLISEEHGPHRTFVLCLGNDQDLFGDWNTEWGTDSCLFIVIDVSCQISSICACVHEDI